MSDSLHKVAKNGANHRRDKYRYEKFPIEIWHDTALKKRKNEWEQGIAFKSQILNETRIARRSMQEAAENICWHLEINGAKNYDEKAVLAMLKERFKGEFIDEKIDSQMKLFVF